MRKSEIDKEARNALRAAARDIVKPGRWCQGSTFGADCNDQDDIVAWRDVPADAECGCALGHIANNSRTIAIARRAVMLLATEISFNDTDPWLPVYPVSDVADYNDEGWRTAKDVANMMRRAAR